MCEQLLAFASFSRSLFIVIWQHMLVLSGHLSSSCQYLLTGQVTLQGPACITLPYKKMLFFKHRCLNNSGNSIGALCECQRPASLWLLLLKFSHFLFCRNNTSFTFPFKPTKIHHHPLHLGQNFQGISYNKIYTLKNQVNLCLVRQPVYQESKQSHENENVWFSVDKTWWMIASQRAVQSYW